MYAFIIYYENYMYSDNSCISLTGMLITVITAYFMTSLPCRLQVVGWGGGKWDLILLDL